MPPNDSSSRIRVLRGARPSPAPAADLHFEDGAAHVHGALEAFPREAVRDLVGGTLAGRRRREIAQDVLLSAGLFLIALAVPTERLLGDGLAPVQWTERGQWLSINLLLQPLTQLLAAIPGFGAERAWYFLAAACWAGSYAVLARMNVALGFSRLAACSAALLTVASPMAVLAATLPGPAGAQVLGSSLLFATLITRPARRPDGSASWLPVGAWAGGCLLDPSLLLFFPALVLHGLTGSAGALAPKSLAGRLAGALGRPLAALALLGAPLALASFLAGSPRGGASVGQALVSRLVGTASTGAPESLIWLLVLPAAIGVGLLGIVELFQRSTDARADAGHADSGRASRGDEGGRAASPLWIAAFVAVPIGVKVFGGAPNLETGAWVLGPLTALGLASFLDRRSPARQWMFILPLAALQLALSVAFQVTVGLGDPARAWHATAESFLEAGDAESVGDLVLTRDQRHDYLLRHRLGLRTINLRTPRELDEAARADWWAGARMLVREQARAGGRVVVDWKVADPVGGPRPYPFQQELHELVLLAPVLHLDPRGETRSDPETEKLPRSLDGL